VDSSELDDTGRLPLAHHFSSSLLTINVEVCQLLLEIERNADFVDKHGQTLAHLCARLLDFSVKIINVLREKGVDMTKSDLKGRTVLYCAAIRGSITKESLDFLCDIIGLRLSAKDSCRKTALQYAREEALKNCNR
jgi:ankyrin repeat protein